MRPNAHNCNPELQRLASPRTRLRCVVIPKWNDARPRFHWTNWIRSANLACEKGKAGLACRRESPCSTRKSHRRVQERLMATPESTANRCSIVIRQRPCSRFTREHFKGLCIAEKSQACMSASYGVSRRLLLPNGSTKEWQVEAQTTDKTSGFS